MYIVLDVADKQATTTTIFDHGYVKRTIKLRAGYKYEHAYVLLLMTSIVFQNATFAIGHGG